MASELNDTAKNIIDGNKNFAHLATLMPDGTPQVTPVWVDTENGNVVINSAEGRLKVKNVKRDPRVGVDITDSENPYSYVAVRGKVVDVTTEGADEHIDKLAKKYMGVDEYPLRTPDEVRVKIVIEPERVQVQAGE
ncbi:MAG TPA: PPOX class F420-dependent oxidoreductase [Solirubrobacterales bacterium]|jgi:PPOX class probable F420-dependent enzyme|nr:PPOX class F420-dependent oxidoreductase [Solirubrobacterales bacterium]